MIPCLKTAICAVSNKFCQGTNPSVRQLTHHWSIRSSNPSPLHNHRYSSSQSALHHTKGRSSSFQQPFKYHHHSQCDNSPQNNKLFHPLEIINNNHHHNYAIKPSNRSPRFSPFHSFSTFVQKYSQTPLFGGALHSNAFHTRPFGHHQHHFQTNNNLAVIFSSQKYQTDLFSRIPRLNNKYTHPKRASSGEAPQVEAPEEGQVAKAPFWQRLAGLFRKKPIDPLLAEEQAAEKRRSITQKIREIVSWNVFGKPLVAIWNNYYFQAYGKQLCFVSAIVTPLTMRGFKKEDEIKVFIMKYVADLNRVMEHDWTQTSQRIDHVLTTIDITHQMAAEGYVKLMIGSNALVFILHQLADDTQGFLAQIMDKYFVATPNSGRVLPWLLCVWSHKDLMHFGMNMMALWKFGPIVGADLGVWHLVTLLAGGGVFASAVSHYFKFFVLKSQMNVGSLGASGGIMAILGAYGLLRQDEKMDIFGYKVRSYYIIHMALTFDFLGLMGRYRNLKFMPPVDHVAHIGGMVFGLLYTTGVMMRGKYVKDNHLLDPYVQAMESEEDLLDEFEQLQFRAQRQQHHEMLKPRYESPYSKRASVEAEDTIIPGEPPRVKLPKSKNLQTSELDKYQDAIFDKLQELSREKRLVKNYNEGHQRRLNFLYRKWKEEVDSHGNPHNLRQRMHSH